MDGHLAKPFDQAALNAALVRAVAAGPSQHPVPDSIARLSAALEFPLAGSAGMFGFERLALAA